MNQGHESRHDENGVIIFAPALQQPKAWTDEEDDLLLKLRDEDELEWDTITESLPGRNARAVERRFTHLARRLTTQQTNRRKKKPKKRKAPFNRMFTKYSTEEDDQLIKLREVDKLTWADIALRLPGRNAMALQKRYVRELAYRNQELGDDPLVQTGDGVFRAVNMKHARFTPDEDKVILYLRNDLELDWSQIKMKMPGRERQSLENRYRHLQKKLAEVAPRATKDDQPNDPIGGNAEQSDDELMQDAEDLSTLDPSLGPSTEANNQTNTGAFVGNDSPGDHNRSPQGHGFFSEGGIRFTAEEDTCIRQLRELDKLSWEAIAMKLPGRRVSAISARYYQHLFPRLESVNPWSTATALQSFAGAKPLEIASRVNLGSNGIASKRALRWTQEEGDMVAHYYNQGLDFEQIGERMPWRSYTAIKHFYTTRLEPKNSSGKLVAAKSRNDLLRQAVGNTVRHSVSSLEIHSTLIDLTLDNSDDDSPGRRHEGPSQLRRSVPQPPPRDEQSRLHRKYAPHLNTSAARIRRAPAKSRLPHGHPSPKAPPVDAYASLLSQYLAGRDSPSPVENKVGLSPEPPTPSRARQPLSTPTVPETAYSVRYSTPAAYHRHAHPYFVPPPANKHVPLFSEHGLSTQRTIIDPRLLEGLSEIPLPSLNLSRAGFEPQRSLSVGNARAPDIDTNKIGDVAHDDDNAFNNLFGVDKDMFANDGISRIEDPYRPESTLAAESDREMPARQGHSPGVSLVDNANSPFVEQQFLGLDGTHDILDTVHNVGKYEVASTSREALVHEDEGILCGQEDEIDMQPSEFVSPQEIYQLADANWVEEDNDTQVASPSSDHDLLHDSGYFEGAADLVQGTDNVEVENDVKDDLFAQDLPQGTPPPHFWQDLLMMVFEAKGSKPVNVKDIYAFIEDQFPYYKHNTSAWKDGIQACLDTQPEFVQVSRFRPLWVYKNSLQHTELVAASEPTGSDGNVEPERLITVKSLRERPPRAEQAGQVKKGPGRPRKSTQHKIPATLSDPSYQQHEPVPVVTIADDKDELAPSPDKTTLRKSMSSPLRTSSIHAAPSNKDASLHESISQDPSSDIMRDPESSPAVTRHAFNNAVNVFQGAMSEISKISSAMLSSSSPLMSMKTPATVYSKADTPGTSHSTLFGCGRPQHRGIAALRSSVAPGSGRSRSSSVALPGSRKRVIYTPVRDVEGSEDELG